MSKYYLEEVQHLRRMAPACAPSALWGAVARLLQMRGLRPCSPAALPVAFMISLRLLGSARFISHYIGAFLYGRLGPVPSWLCHCFLCRWLSCLPAVELSECEDKTSGWDLSGE